MIVNESNSFYEVVTNELTFVGVAGRLWDQVNMALPVGTGGKYYAGCQVLFWSDYILNPAETSRVVQINHCVENGSGLLKGAGNSEFLILEVNPFQINSGGGYSRVNIFYNAALINGLTTRVTINYLFAEKKLLRSDFM